MGAVVSTATRFLKKHSSRWSLYWKKSLSKSPLLTPYPPEEKPPARAYPPIQPRIDEEVIDSILNDLLSCPVYLPPNRSPLNPTQKAYSFKIHPGDKIEGDQDERDIFEANPRVPDHQWLLMPAEGKYEHSETESLGTDDEDNLEPGRKEGIRSLPAHLGRVHESSRDRDQPGQGQSPRLL